MSGSGTILPMQEIAIQMARTTPRQVLMHGVDEWETRARGSGAAAAVFGILTAILAFSALASLGGGGGAAVILIVLGLLSFTATRFALKNRGHSKSMAALGMMALSARDIYEMGGEEGLAQLLAESRRRAGL